MLFKYFTLFLVFLLIRKIIILYFTSQKKSLDSNKTKNTTDQNTTNQNRFKIKESDAETIDFEEIKNN